MADVTSYIEIFSTQSYAANLSGNVTLTDGSTPPSSVAYRTTPAQDDGDEVDVVLIVALSLFGLGVLLLLIGFLKVIHWCYIRRSNKRYSKKWLRHLEHKRRLEEFAIRSRSHQRSTDEASLHSHSQFEWSGYLEDTLTGDKLDTMSNGDVFYNNDEFEKKPDDKLSYISVTKEGDDSHTKVSYISDGVVSIMVEGVGVIDGVPTPAATPKISPRGNAAPRASPRDNSSHTSTNLPAADHNAMGDTSSGVHAPGRSTGRSVLHSTQSRDLKDTCNHYPYDNNNNIITIRDQTVTPAHSEALATSKPKGSRTPSRQKSGDTVITQAEYGDFYA